MTTSKRRG